LTSETVGSGVFGMWAHELRKKDNAIVKTET
jgi:hypothetical protein